MSQSAHITDIARQAAILVGKAQALGLVLTISNKPLQPLAMGNHVPDIDVRPARETAAAPHWLERMMVVDDRYSGMKPLDTSRDKIVSHDARASSKTASDRAWAERIVGKPPISKTAAPTSIAQLMEVLKSLSSDGQVEVYFTGPESDSGSVH
jgi:hypothetical protein